MNPPHHDEDDATLAATLGKGYAHLQHWMDKGIAWGLGKMRESAANTPPSSRKDESPVGGLKRVGRAVVRFFGEAGTTYYETYEELKARERK